MPPPVEARQGSVFETLTCSAPAERTLQMRDVALAHIPVGARRVLDLGCGTGRLAMELASARPTTELIGIDISAANIAAASAGAQSRAIRNVRFDCADYLAYATGPFDAIVTDGVLHFIPGETPRLVDKLSRDLAPGGMLVCAMPYATLYNSMLTAARRALKAVRSPALDRFILGTGRLLHGSMTAATLSERVHYMYLAPNRVEDAGFHQAMQNAGLRMVRRYPMASTSAVQLKHRVTIYQKDRADRSA